MDERSTALERIAATVAVLRGLEADGREPFVWEHEQRRRWWAFGPFGRYTVSTPLRFGWPVGDYPWEGWVTDRTSTYAHEVFIKPTFVDADGRIAPIDAGPASPTDNPLLTAPMCAEIAARLHQLTKAAPDAPG
jgi:hypothetical protein